MTAEDSPPKKICIIGSGPAGSILAAALAKRNSDIDVTVIEAGTENPDFDLAALAANIDAGAQTDMRFGFSRQIGGATNLWAGRITPMEEIDFNVRSWIPESGWPFTCSELVEYYKKACEILGVQEDILISDNIELPPGFHNLGKAEVKKFAWASRPFHAGKYLQEAVKNHSNLHLISGTRVKKLLHDPASRKITQAETIDTDGNTAFTTADVFVVAAGGLETPRLLLNSGTAVCGLGAENVGRYLSTHPKADMALLRLNERVSLQESPLYMDKVHANGALRYGLGFPANYQAEKELLNHYIQLSPMVEYKATKLFEKIRGGGALNSGFFNRNKILKGILPSLGLFFYELIGRVAGLQKKTRLFMLRAFLDQIPDKEHKVVLSTEADIYGIPKVDIVWNYTEQDKNLTLAFFDLMDKSLRDAGIGYIEYSQMRELTDWPLIGIHSHFMGATRMGTSPHNSVTDKYAKVHGIPNLYISGPSLFPTYGYANPVLTISALALRMADNIYEEVGKSEDYV